MVPLAHILALSAVLFVTGVAGFVASNLARHLLDRGYVVIGIDNLSAGTLENIDSRVEFAGFRGRGRYYLPRPQMSQQRSHER